MINNVATTALA